VSFPVGNQDDYEHFIVDCGVHGKGNIGTINRAVDHIMEETGGKLAAVIATHSHQDHISGFSEKFTQFKEIREVWLPWSEDPADPLAIKWGKKQAAVTSQLEQHFAAQAKTGAAEASSPHREKALAALVNLSSSADSMSLLVNHFKGGDAKMVENFGKLTSNAKALQLLKGGFNIGAKVRYLDAGKTLEDAAGVQGLTVRVLSPPRDEKFLSKMDPPKGQGYLRMGAGGEVVEANKTAPFASKWVIDYQKTSGKAPLTAEEEKLLGSQLSDTELNGLAFALDSAKNNTSLVTLFIYRGQYLLFPGDAQYGNWKYWLDKEADEILPRVNFLKVAHHGSHNATPKEALEKMATGKFAAMVSTQSTPWDSIPRVPLMTRLSEQTAQKVVRSDWIKLADAPDPSEGATPPMPAEDPQGFKKGEFWYDYEI
jgi:beta-lactamase superfamily II metal-dependent hydrolase